MAKALHVGDLHLTARPQDEYRWEVFRWLRTQALNREVDGVFINGDLTDQKDNHPAALVNRLVAELRETAKVAPVYINKGNHDYVDHLNPFFRFLSGISGDVRYFVEPEALTLWGDRYLILPHHRKYKAWWKRYDFSKFDRILIHQAIRGAKMPGGYGLADGASSRPFRRCRGLVIAGDIHVPQTVGQVVYCGSPYPINFGDDFRPRALLDDGGKLLSISRACIRKASLTLSCPEELLEAGLTDGDLAKVTLLIPRSEFCNWERLRAATIKAGERIGVRVCGVDLKRAEEESRVRIKGKRELRKGPGILPADWVRLYCKDNKVGGELAEFGLTLVNGGRP